MHRAAFLDWLGCVAGGRDEPAARAAAGAGDDLLDRVAAVGTAGHVLDFDDTYTPGLAHVSAPVGPAALVVGADRDASSADVLAAFAEGWEAMAAVARASHPALYSRGLHPTAVAGAVGAAVATAVLLGLDEERLDDAAALALLRGAGLQAAFGGHGKALQVGLAAAAGASAARLVAAGARVDLERAADGFGQAHGGAHARPDPAAPAVRENWIKAYPCCLQTHGPIEVAARAREAGVGPDDDITITVHPIAPSAARYGADVKDGLQAKFSIPYTTAYALLHGAPTLPSDFATVEPQARQAAANITVLLDEQFGEQEATISANRAEIARVHTAQGSPARPLTPDRLQAKTHDLAGRDLTPLVDGSAREILAAVT